MNKNTQTCIVALAVMLTLSFGLSTAYGQNKEHEIIKGIAQQWQDNWNRHDMKESAALVEEDIDFITSGGTWLKGRKMFEEYHVELHKVKHKEAVQTVKNTEVKFIRPGIAVAHVEWSMTGDKDLDGTPRQPRQGIMTWVLEKRKGKWVLIASQNTNIKEPVSSK